MFRLFLCYVLVLQRAVEHLFVWQFCFSKALPSIHEFVTTYNFLPKQVSLLLLCASSEVYFKCSRGMLFTSESNDACKKLKLSRNRRPPMKSWCSFPYCLEYTLSSCLLFSTSPETNDVHRILVILPKRVSLFAYQLFRILWSLSIFSEKLACKGVSSKVENHTPNAVYLWLIILVSRRGGRFLKIYRSQSIGLQFLHNWLKDPRSGRKCPEGIKI